MGITKKSFGKTSKNEAASLYILENKNGMKAVFTDYGANLVELWVPDKNGKLDHQNDIVGDPRLYHPISQSVQSLSCVRLFATP